MPGGGAPRLATAVKELSKRPNTVMVAAGDLIGASPLLSSLFHDEPTIEAMSEMGLAITSVGNHEFDEGWQELRRMQTGGCHPVDGCKGPKPFAGAKFEYLAASTYLDDGTTLFPPYTIREFDGVKVGFIGLTLEGHAGRHHAGRARRHHVQGRSRDGERARAEAAGAGRRGHRRAAARGRLHHRHAG